MNHPKYTNSLIHESSPYLLQHAHNPVDWMPWGPEALEKARKEDRLILVSIGYAACHWCHVMEKECFEDTEAAELMNEHYVSIKIDREERPDIDHYYLTAVQLTGAQGGWPLNCVALPDGRPLWGGTYFPKENWMMALRELNRLYTQHREDTLLHAEKLSAGISVAFLQNTEDNGIKASKQSVVHSVQQWKNRFDRINGGNRGIPKFPMPVNLDFLLQYGYTENDPEVTDFVHLTLNRMASGGIYDHAGGGFARYATDERWKIPHFEKMLYDNAQLISVYSKAVQITGDQLYRDVVSETIDFTERELMHPSGAFFSSLDADSEGLEGKFYTWTEQELRYILKNDYGEFAGHYNIHASEVWEDDRYILYTTRDKNTEKLFHERKAKTGKIQEWKKILLQNRASRVRPGLDDKVVTSWNGLMIQGLCDAYKACGTEKFLNMAIANGRFILENMAGKNGSLFRIWKSGKATLPGFLDDYAQTISGFISLFEVTGDELWAGQAEKLTEFTISHFLDKEKDLFCYRHINAREETPNYYETEDNVIPSSNAAMAHNLLKLSRLFAIPEYERQALRMFRRIAAQQKEYPYAFAKWGQFMLSLENPFMEVAVTGENAPEMLADLQKKYYPAILWAGSIKSSGIPLLKNRFIKGKTLIYVCTGSNCQMPVETADEAHHLIRTLLH